MNHFFFVDLKGLEDDIERIAALEQKVFPFQVLVSATKNFHPTHKLGEGGFGPVFKVTSILASLELKVSIFRVLVVVLQNLYCVLIFMWLVMLVWGDEIDWCVIGKIT